MDTELILGRSAAALVSIYNQSMESLHRIAKELDEIEIRMNETFGDYTFPERDDIRFHTTYQKPTEVLACERGVRAKVWQAIITRSEVRRILSVERAAKLDKSIEDDALGEITEENLFAVLKSIHGNIATLGEESLFEVYKWLMFQAERSYKTNQKFQRIPKKVIIRGITWYCGSGKAYVSSYYADAYRSLANAFYMLSGRGAAGASYGGELYDAIEASDNGEGQTEYFTFKCYANGNCHLTFRRPDLLQKLNLMFANRTLTEK